jgi:uncharacterized protein (TIGR02145 family)
MRYSLLLLYSILFLWNCKTEEPQNLLINPLKDNVTKVVEVKSKTGRIWMDRNLGASQVAASPTDEKAYGDLYQWGRGADGHQLRTSATTLISSSKDVPGNSLFVSFSSNEAIFDYNDWRKPQNDNLWQGINGINNPCPVGFRIPTEKEWDDERKSWLAGINSEGAIASSLKLPMAGVRISLVCASCSSSFITDVGISGNYWSSSTATGILPPFLKYSYSMFFSTEPTVNTGPSLNPNKIMNLTWRYGGHSVRCIKD